MIKFFSKAILVLIISTQLVLTDVSFAIQNQMSPFGPSFQSNTQGGGVILMPQAPVMSLPFRDDDKITIPESMQDRQSEFEAFIADKPIEIDEFQFDVLKKFDDISFQYTTKSLPAEYISVPVRIMKVTKKLDTKTEQLDKIKSGDINKDDIKTQITGFEISKEAAILIDAGYFVGSRDKIASAFKLVGIKTPFDVSREIKQFGYDMFTRPSFALKSSYNAPVGPDYVIGPGDEIKISLWGMIEGEQTVTVERDGKVTFAKVGTIGVAGLTFKELKDVLHKEFSKYFTNFQMNVSMGNLRTIKVYVTGSANRPGAYTVSSLSTLVNAIFQAFGPAKTGSMRDIQLKRNGKTVVNFDMYDFLIKGDKSKDVRLMPEDVIFIPPSGPLVGMAGSVNNPAVYELKAETSVAQLIDLAGGLSDVASKGSVQIERIIDNSRQTVMESSLDEAKGMKVQSGDVVKVYPVVQDRRTVKIFGAVQRAGEYGLKKNMTVRDLVGMAGGLKYYAYPKEAELSRVAITDKGTTSEKFLVNIEKALAGDTAHNLKLGENDYLFIRTTPEWQLQKKVSISGEVKFPGTYVIKKGEKLSSLIDRAGGYTTEAYLKGAVFLRQSVKELQQKGLDEMAIRLERELTVGSASEISTAVSAEEIQAKRAEAEQKQKFIESLRKLKASGRMSIKLAHIRLLKGSEHDFELEENDTLHIPQRSSVVNVVGAVMSQGSFVYSDKLDYKDYVDLSGGYSRFADEDNAYVLKADGSARRLSRGILSWNSGRDRWEFEGFENESREINPGDSIVVPEKFARVAWLRDIRDISQILMNMAVTTGVIWTIFKK
ncbi:MAG: polysaccharide export protein [Nitrospirae bacterium]|nr:MAG: polysaccharide export protein [Nitrospirota bacterium]